MICRQSLEPRNQVNHYGSWYQYLYCCVDAEQLRKTADIAVSIFSEICQIFYSTGLKDAADDEIRPKHDWSTRYAYLLVDACSERYLFALSKDLFCTLN